MDCCNYMQYRHSYYGSQYYDNLNYNGNGNLTNTNVGGGDYYGHYPDYYGNTSSCYGMMQPWTSAAHFSGKITNLKNLKKNQNK